ncbi:uncharacterized protein LOC115216485 [Octopus sinensis]|uniref:Uncharacterized protein LOC115216485 n=1 Tax=Octopus sinensis TaxID=2607531 RepID=A0A6P7SU55_9MOLL|nr:uncharacterized protein LOC115216485 [Octopus sinensis]
MAESLEAKIEKYSQENVFLHKYCILKKKCDTLQQSNERIVNRIQHVKKLIKRFKKERRFLSNKLDEHGDNYREASVPVMWEEDQIYLNANQTKVKSPPESCEEEPPSRVAKGSLGFSSLLETTGKGPLPSALAKVRKMKADKKDGVADSSKKHPSKNAFLTFYEHHKNIVQDEYFQRTGEEIPHHVLIAKVTDNWHNLTPEKKQVYYDMYERVKEPIPNSKYSSQETNEELVRKQSEEAAVAAANLLADDSDINVKQEMET